MSELKPCWFCGSKNLSLYYFDVDDRDNPFDPCVRCNKCRTIFRFCDGHGSLDDIQKVWNGELRNERPQT